jgi:cellulose biosynthesis protein BcsQ
MICTFYSYKGGVGRSMALANVADALARKGLRVLMIDFDLEAPGLEQFFRIDHDAARRHAGLLDLLLSYKQAMSMISSTAVGTASFRRLQEQFITPVYGQLPAGGRLDLLTAGRRGNDQQLNLYALNLRTFDWEDFYFNWAGEAFFEWLRQTLLPDQYDIVLVDSRTGVTEMGGICAYQLADMIVLMCASNQQNLEGTQNVVKNFLSPEVQALRATRPLQVVVVPSRVEQRDPVLLEQLRNRFDAAFDEYTPEPVRRQGRAFWDLLVPYEPRYAFDEQVISHPQRASERKQMEAAYNGLVDVLGLLAEPGSALAGALATPTNGTAESTTAEPQYDPTRRFAGYDAYIAYRAADQSTVDSVATSLRASGISVFLDCLTLPASEDWRASASLALSQSNVLLVFVGDGTAAEWQRGKSEVVFGSGARRPPILPVLLPGAPDTSDLGAYPPGSFDRDNWFDLRPEPINLDALQRLVDSIRGLASRVPAPAIEHGPPYRGLRPYDEEVAGEFFGRDAEIEDILDELNLSRLVAVIGPSGSGKSSLVRAGVIPRLRRAARSGSETLTVCVFTPGSRPLQSLADELVHAFPHLAEPIRQALVTAADTDTRSTESSVGGVLAAIMSATHSILLVVDQFEELFTLCRATDERGRFVASLVAAATTPSRCKVLLTLRADFYGQCVADPQLAKLLPSHQVLLGPLSDQGLAQAIQAPAQRAGLAFEPGLVERILHDAQGRVGALPLLQVVLQELWQRRREGWLTHAAYTDVGGLGGAIASRAEAVYADLTQQTASVTRLVLLRLVQPGEDAADTRRRVRLRDLSGASRDPQLVLDVVRALTDAHLLTMSSEPQTGEAAVEISHEALISGWPRLQGWIDEDRAHLLTLRRLSRTAVEWEKANRDNSLLYRGSRLVEIEELGNSDSLPLNDLERQFLRASIDLQKLEAERDVQRRTLEERYAHALKDWRQATSCAFGTGLGYALSFALLGVIRWNSAVGVGLPVELRAVVLVVLCGLGFAVGIVNGFGIGFAIWLWERRGTIRLVTVVIGTASGFVSLAVFAGVTGDQGWLPVGACLGAGLTLGAVSTRRRVGRLLGTALGGLGAGAAVANWIPRLPADAALLIGAGAAIGIATGLGLYFGKSKDV